ncbi:MAG: hypothetical protein JHC84_15980 [Solirubrobacteraceae bacterium]|nr:hypothetical protein [Solirubrobacteraceae bacterium]
MLRLTAGLTITAALAMAAPAAADERVCRGTIGAVTVDDVRVPSGATCRLSGTRVDGNVKVGSRATLRATRVTVDGDIQAEGHRLVTVTRGSRIDGNIQLEEGGSASLYDNRVEGDIQLFENRGAQRVRRNVVGGNLQCKENRSGPTGSGNRVEGDKEDQCARL